MTKSPTASQQIIAEVTSLVGTRSAKTCRGIKRAWAAARRIANEADVRYAVERLRLNHTSWFIGTSGDVGTS